MVFRGGRQRETERGTAPLLQPLAIWVSTSFITRYEGCKDQQVFSKRRMNEKRYKEQHYLGTLEIQ